MASTEGSAAARDVTVQPLARLDTPALAMLESLVADSGWNQVAADWELFHAAGSIHVVRDASGAIVASGAVLPMNEPAPGASGVSWISMILVHSSQRGQGLGRAVFAHCLQKVRDSGRIAMLDATPAGEALYRQFGFEPLWRLTRWRREPRAAIAPALVQDVASITAIVDLDRQAQGFERPHVLAHLLGRPSSRCVRSADALALVRAGRTAHHVGPLLASSEAAGASLFTHVSDAIDGALLADVPDERPAMRAALHAAGFQPQRGFARMALVGPGQALPPGQPAFLHAVAGPEFA